MTTPAPDLSTWLTKQEASARIGVSSKTLEKLAVEGKLQALQRRNPGSPPLTVYHPGDVERVAAERNPEAPPFIVPRGGGVAELPEAASRTALTRPPVGWGDGFTLLSEALREAAQVARPPRLFLSIKEAAQLTGLTQRYLKERIEKKELDAIQDGRRLRIRRKDLEDL